jgi:hypothetical protein
MIGWLIAKSAAKVYTAPAWALPYSAKKTRKAMKKRQLKRKLRRL